MTNEKMAINVAIKLSFLLCHKDITTECHQTKLTPISSTLRSCWYVKKLKEMGHTDCIHIGLSCGGFLAVLEDGQIMTGNNPMINDGITELAYELSSELPCIEEVFNSFLWKGFCDDFGDNGIIVCDYNQFKKMIDSLS